MRVPGALFLFSALAALACCDAWPNPQGSSSSSSSSQPCFEGYCLPSCSSGEDPCGDSCCSEGTTCVAGSCVSDDAGDGVPGLPANQTPVPAGSSSSGCASGCAPGEVCLPCGATSACVPDGSTCCSTGVCGPSQTCLACPPFFSIPTCAPAGYACPSLGGVAEAGTDAAADAGTGCVVPDASAGACTPGPACTALATCCSTIAELTTFTSAAGLGCLSRSCVATAYTCDEGACQQQLTAANATGLGTQLCAPPALDASVDASQDATDEP